MSLSGGMIRLDRNDPSKLHVYGRGLGGKVLCWFQPWGNRVIEALMAEEAFLLALEKDKRGENIFTNVKVDLERLKYQRFQVHAMRTILGKTGQIK